MSSNPKSAALWNVMDPGDPYDIKKSMIARLPDHPPKPMGQHLELICLLQAAQIERLSDFLAELRVKYRQVDRRELDRHSYEVQIKELAEKDYKSSIMKNENQRLLDFIRRQTQQLEELQKKQIQTANMETLQAKYDNLLNELRIVREQREGGQNMISRLNLELSEWRGKVSRLQQERISLSTQFEVQLKQRIAIQMKSIRQKTDQRSDKLLIELRQVRDQNENKNQQIQMLFSQKEQLLKQIRLLEERNKNRGNIQEALNDKNRQIQRLNVVLSDVSKKLQLAQAAAQKMSGELTIIEDRYGRLQRDYQETVLRLRECEVNKGKKEGYQKLQEKVVMMSMQIERLNGINSGRSREYIDTSTQLQRVRMDLRILKEQSSIDKQKISQLQMNLQVLQPNESKIALLSQQIERMNFLLKNKTDQISTITQQLQINEQSSVKLSILVSEKSRLQQQLQASKTQQKNFKTITESQLNTLRSQNHKLRQQIQYRNSSNKGETQKYRIESERLKIQIQKIKSDSDRIRRSLDDQKSLSIKLSNQKNNLLSENEQMLNELLQMRKDVQGLRLMLRSGEQKQQVILAREREINILQQRIYQLSLQIQQQNRLKEKQAESIDSIYKQIERLHGVLSLKVNQQEKLVKDNKMYQQRCKFIQSKVNSLLKEKQFYQNQALKIKQFYQREVSKLKLDIEAISKYTSQANKTVQSKIYALAQQREKLQETIRQKDRLIGQYTKQKQNLQKRVIEIQRDQAYRVGSEDQVRKEKDKLFEEIKNKDTKIYQLQILIREKQSYSKQSEAKIRQWESRVSEWENRLRDAEKLQSVSYQQNQKLKRDVGRLNDQIARLNIELQDLNKKREIVGQQNFGLKKKLDEMSREQGNRNQQELLRSQLQMAEEALNRQRRETESLRTKLNGAQDRLNRMSQQLQGSRRLIKQYQDKIVHIQNTNAIVFQQRERKQFSLIQQKDTLIITLERRVKYLQQQLNSFQGRQENNNNFQTKISLISSQLMRQKQVNQHLGKQMQQKVKIINDLSYKFQNNQNQITNLKTMIDELYNINDHTAAERDELFTISHELKDKLDSYQKKQHSQDSSSLQKISQLLMQIQQLTRSNQNLKNQTNILIQQNNKMVLQRQQLQRTIQQNQIQNQRRGERQNEQLRMNVRQLTDELKIKSDLLLEWQMKYNTLYTAYESLYNNYQITKKQYEVTYVNIKDYQEKLFKLEQNFQELSNYLTTVKGQNQYYKRQIYQLNLKMKEQGNLVEKNLFLSKEVDRLNFIKNELTIEVSDLQMRIIDSTSLQKRIEEQLALMVVLFAQIQSLRDRLSATEFQCEQVRRNSLVPCRIDRIPKS